MSGIERRDFLASIPMVLQARPKPKVAAIVTTYYYYSHADVIVGRMLEGYHPDNVPAQPRTEIVSMYTDQVSEKDLSRKLAARHGFRIYPSIAEALSLGGEKLAVDAVLLIGEHGDYPNNDRGQKMYPRFELFQKITEVFRRSKRCVPVFSDKHLSYSWQKAKAMYDEAKELRFPLMAGSSIPVTVRQPPLELPAGCRIEHALSVGYANPDAYGFHTLEGLQCMVERRRGGERGIRSVEWLEGDAVWKWRDGEGKWSKPLLDAALATGTTVAAGSVETTVKRPIVFLLEYRDGLRAAAYLLDGHVKEFLFAAQLAGGGGPLATNYLMKMERPLPHFDGLVRCIEEFFVTGKPTHPVERTLLVSGALDFLFGSKAAGKRIETPDLAVAYRAPARPYWEKA